jgi:Cu/Ag efflux protein CusF
MSQPILRKYSGNIPDFDARGMPVFQVFLSYNRRPTGQNTVMHSRLRLLLLLGTVAPIAVPAATPPPAAEKKTDAAKRYPLRGVVTSVDTERSALMVKHEEIPGVMRAMTMMFKVDPAVLKAVKKGDAISGEMARDEGGWRLHAVKIMPPPPPSR